MEHSFDINIAAKYGIHTAILLKNLHFWIVKNRANEKHYHEGKYWTYNSQKAFAELFPYLTERQVKYTIEKMKKDELIIVGNFNENPYDKTSWYALTDKAFELLGDEQKNGKKPENTDSTKLSSRTDKSVPIDETKLSNGENKIVSSYIDTDNKPDNKQKERKKETKKTFNEIIDEYTNNEELRMVLKEHLKIRKLKNALTDISLQLGLRTLSNIGKTESEEILIVQQSIENGWTSFYPLKQIKENYQSSYDIDEYEKHSIFDGVN